MSKKENIKEIKKIMTLQDKFVSLKGSGEKDLKAAAKAAKKHIKG